ncbi:deoxyhypusine hydroxylase [Daktulosphaira vitifoliae]|uniref:deoxyhypusine hydroxylase n=1 Tax=Daktulosphaira vitifoliae TaxID=58002 RepID=UPI0021A9CC88|nr:deoxyhypusine hydroxylase [Daktulosphaira vitifoliae]
MANHDEVIKRIGSVLANSKLPMKERFRALFTLKNIGGNSAIDNIAKCFTDSSCLLKHELAYCLGQMRNEYAIPYLIKVLKDVDQEPMVRHEAAEALGAIGKQDVIPILEEYKNDPVQELAETCQLALGRLLLPKNEANVENIYGSVDPAPPSSIKSLEELEKILNNENESLFDRYKAMFSLRDIGSPRSITILSKALSNGSALFKHEIAFVLGQLQSPLSVPYLKESLMDESQNDMVRHECAEALGAIATDDCYEILKKYLDDQKIVVKESCEVALDMCDYENCPDFQYANTLEKIIS